VSNQKPHINDYKSGMNKDFNPESFPATGYEDANNVRVFTSGNGASLGAIQNILGNQLIVDLPEVNGNQLYIIGTCQLRDSIIVFATPSSSQEGGHGYIYEVDFNFQSLESTITLIYDDADLRFSRLNPIEAIGIQENENYERVYFSDFQNPTRSINIRDAAINDSPVLALNFFPNPGIERPVINNIDFGGSLRPGIYSYAYYFTTFGGNSTILSPVSAQVHIVKDSDNNTPNTREYKGVPEGIDDDDFTAKLVNVQVDLTSIPENTFSEITLVAIYVSDFGELPQVLQVTTESIQGNTNSINLVHTGAELQTTVILFEEFVTENVPFKTNKTFGIKDNILFCANIKGQDLNIPEDISQGLRAIRYRNTQNSYVDDGFSIYNNPYNDESGTVFGTNPTGTYDFWSNLYQYKYLANGTTLGGQGTFISYTFTLERMEAESSVNDGGGAELNYFYNTQQTLESIDIGDDVPYINRSFRGLESPYKRFLRGYKRGETYRFGIVFFNSAGAASTVQFIGDIKFPEISDRSDLPVGTTNGGQDIFHFPTALSRGYDESGTPHYSDIYSLGIEFNINLPQDFIDNYDIAYYQIVRTKRRDQDKTRLAQGVINKWYVPVSRGAGEDPENLSGFEGDTKVFYPISEMTDITGHLNRYMKHDSDGIVYGERADAFQISNLTSAAIEGINGGFAILAPFTAGLGYNYHPTNLIDPRTGIGYRSGGVAPIRRNIIETSVAYQNAAAVESLVSFFCPEATYNHFVPQFNNGNDYLKTVGILSYTTKHSDEFTQFPFGLSSDSINHIFDTALTIYPQWGHTYYSVTDSMEAGTIQGPFFGFIDGRPMLGANNVGNPPGQHANYPEYDNAPQSMRRFVTKARQVSPLNVFNESLTELHLSEDNLERIIDLRYVGPDTYRDDATINIDGYNCRNLAWQLGNVHADAAEKTRMGRGGTSLIASLGPLTSNRGWGGSGTDGYFIAKNNDFQATAGANYENYAGSAFLVDYTRRISNQYGGNGESALAANTFFATSGPIRPTNTTFKVFEGDTFITFYEFMKNFWNNQWDGVTAFQGDNSGTYEIVILPVESTINCALNAGGTIRRGGRFSHDDTPPQGYRLQEHTDALGTTNIAFNGTSKAFDYKPLFSEDQVTKTYFSEPINFRPVNNFDVRTYYSNTKILGEKLDSFTTFGKLNYKDIDPAYGPINKLLNLQDEIVTIQDDAIGVFLINTRELLASESNSLVTIGTGLGVQDFSYITTQNGSIHQYASIVSDQTAYILDAKRKCLVILKGTQPANLSKALGLNDFLNSEIRGMATLTKEQGGDNPLIGIGATLGYDQVNKEVLISIAGNQPGYNLNSTYGQENGFQIVSGNGAVQPSPEVGQLYHNGEPFIPTSPLSFVSYASLLDEVPSLTALPPEYLTEVIQPLLTASIPTRPSGFTLVYSEVLNVFTSFYSFLPSLYVNHNRSLFTLPQSIPSDNLGDKLYIHNQGNYAEFYNNAPSESSVTIFINSTPLLNKILRFIEYNCTVKDGDTIVQSAGLTSIRVENDYQDSGIQPIEQIHKFRKFRIKVPRDQQEGRFRSTYFKVSLYFDNSVNLSLTLQRIMAFFDIQIY